MSKSGITMIDNEKKYFEVGEKLRTVGTSFLVYYLYCING